MKEREKAIVARFPLKVLSINISERKALHLRKNIIISEAADFERRSRFR